MHQTMKVVVAGMLLMVTPAVINAKSVKVAVYDADLALSKEERGKTECTAGDAGIMATLRDVPDCTVQAIKALALEELLQYDIVIVPNIWINRHSKTEAGKVATKQLQEDLVAFALSGGGVLIIGQNLGYAYTYPARSTPFCRTFRP
ncbi:hypothetical protein ACFLQR_05515 [Verrucomicrobiota bacterium]